MIHLNSVSPCRQKGKLCPVSWHGGYGLAGRTNGSRNPTPATPRAAARTTMYPRRTLDMATINQIRKAQIARNLTKRCVKETTIATSTTDQPHSSPTTPLPKSTSPPYPSAPSPAPKPPSPPANPSPKPNQKLKHQTTTDQHRRHGTAPRRRTTPNRPNAPPNTHPRSSPPRNPSPAVATSSPTTRLPPSAPPSGTRASTPSA